MDVFHWDGVTIELISDPSYIDPSEYPTAGYLRIERIASTRPGRGHASAALREICDLADTHGISLDLFVAPEDPRIDPERLASWLARYGFASTGQATGQGWRMMRNSHRSTSSICSPASHFAISANTRAMRS